MTKEEDVTEFKFDDLEGMLENLWNATVEDLCNATESGDWYDIPSDEMTLEQARQAVKYLRKKLGEHLEQEPCDDAISRAETIKYLNINMAWYDEDGEIADSDEKLKAITDLINGVPSVTPKQKTGRWIDTDNYYQRWKCSECGCHARLAPPFCSNCGAKMEVEK